MAETATATATVGRRQDGLRKPTTNLVDQVEDETPARVAGKPLGDTAVGEAAYPWAYLVKHPSFGALRVRKIEAKTEAEAVEVYRQKRCPHMRRELLENTGLRVAALRFTPAETER